MIVQDNFNQQTTSPDATKISEKVLLLDSHRKELKNIKKLLMQNDFQVLCATSIEEASAKISSTNIGLLIFEVSPNNNDFISFIQAIREGDIKNIKADAMIVGYSGDWQKDYKSLCRKAGVDVFFYKPIDPALLMDCLKTKEKYL